MFRSFLLLFLLISVSLPALGQEEEDIIQGSFGGVFNQLNRDIGDVPGNRYWGDFNFQFYKNLPDEFEKKFSFSAQTNDQSLTQYSLQEAYFTKKSVFRKWSETSRTGDYLRIGRQILPWSIADSAWGFGKLNSRINFNFFTPGQEGLIGFTYKNRSKSGFFWRVFVSPIYVPETNPSLDIDKKNKSISSRSPWADPPASSTTIDGKDTPIEYNINYPDIADVVNRPSAGFNFGVEKEHWIIDGFWIRKPENQISTQVEVNYSAVSEKINAYVTPEFYYHDVFGGNLKYRNSNWEMYLTGIAIFPNTFPDQKPDVVEWTEFKTEKKREAYGGGGISRTNDIYSLGFNYIARLSAFDRTQDALVQEPRWNQAVNFFVMRKFTRSLKITADLKYDTMTTDRLTMVQALYSVSADLLMSFGFNMIGTPENGKSFWSPYTNNDAVYASMRYIF